MQEINVRITLSGRFEAAEANATGKEGYTAIKALRR
jgi:hypothetical protein